MKQIEIVNAYMATEQLAENKEFNEMEQWKIYQLRKTLRPHVEFYEERINAIKEGYKDKADEEGKLNGEAAEHFVNDCNQLNNLEINIEDYTKQSLRVVSGINFRTLEVLEKFVDFIPPAGVC